MSKNYIGACLAHNQFGDDEDFQPFIFTNKDGIWIGENSSGNLVKLTSEEIENHFTVVDTLEESDVQKSVERIDLHQHHLHTLADLIHLKKMSEHQPMSAEEIDEVINDLLK